MVFAALPAVTDLPTAVPAAPAKKQAVDVDACQQDGLCAKTQTPFCMIVL